MSPDIAKFVHQVSAALRYDRDKQVPRLVAEWACFRLIGLIIAGQRSYQTSADVAATLHQALTPALYDEFKISLKNYTNHNKPLLPPRPGFKHIAEKSKIRSWRA